MSQNPKYHDLSKHIDIPFHFILDKVKEKQLQLEFTSTTTMWANVLTKSLSTAKYQACLQGLPNTSSSASKQRGDKIYICTSILHKLNFYNYTTEGGVLGLIRLVSL